MNSYPSSSLMFLEVLEGKKFLQKKTCEKKFLLVYSSSKLNKVFQQITDLYIKRSDLFVILLDIGVILLYLNLLFYYKTFCFDKSTSPRILWQVRRKYMPNANMPPMAMRLTMPARTPPVKSCVCRKINLQKNLLLFSS